MNRPVMLALILAGALALGGCKSSAEKAEAHYRSGMAYLEQGDDDRALLEFRNVFRFDGFHLQARKTYADVLMRRGERAEAYSQYLRLIEQYPDTLEVRQALAEMAILSGNWDEAQRHGEAALALAPQDPGLVPIRLTLDYFAAAQRRDSEAGAATAERAMALIEAGATDNLLLARIVIEHHAGGSTPERALPLIDAVLARTPDARDMHMARYVILSRAGDVAGTGAQLRRMAEQFPEDVSFRDTLLAWYMSQNRPEDAEAWLRHLAGPVTGPTEGQMRVVEFLAAARGPAAARAALEALRAANAGQPNGDVYALQLAELDFSTGARAEAIAALRAILAGAPPGDLSRQAQASLARMLAAEGQMAESDSLVAAVLEADRGHVDALLLRASRAIATDRPGDAIVDLRNALDQAPRDSRILTLMAEAHQRDGSIDLAGERLALALEVSDGGVPEALRYAAFLSQRGRFQVASRVLDDAQKRHPGQPALQVALADLYIREGLWDRAAETLDRLEALQAGPQTAAAARELRARLLAGQNRIDDSLAVLEQGIGADGDRQVTLTMLQTLIRAGRLDAARDRLDALRAQNPDDEVLETLDGSLHAMAGAPAEAEAIWRAQLARNPAAELPLRMLHGLLDASGRGDEADSLITAAMAGPGPLAPSLRWMMADLHEKAGRIDAAIALYEALYAEDGSNMVIANNLASLIATHHDDDDSLMRAERIARRLRGQPVPAFQDTYGWIALRRGNLDEALAHLEPAAAALEADPQVQIHLGLLYERLGREAEARARFSLALELAGPDSTLPGIDHARARMATPPSPQN